jgi:hypothetical protein
VQAFTNEDAAFLFRSSHHASTSLGANQKPLDASDLGYCEFLEFLCRLALTSTFKALGDADAAMRMQKLCNVRWACSCDALLPIALNLLAQIIALQHQVLISWSDEKVQAADDAAIGRTHDPYDCFIVPTFCELLPDIYRLFVSYADSSEAALDFVHPDVDAPHFLSLGAFLRLLRDASILDNEVRRNSRAKNRL